MSSCSSSSSYLSDSSQESSAQSFTWVEDDKFFKLSKKIDYVSENEAYIGSKLNELSHSNVVKFLGTIEKNINLFNLEKSSFENLFDEFGVGVQCTIWENMDGVSLEEFITENNQTAKDDKIILNLICQVILTILELQFKLGFVHGDLHSNNVFVCKTKLTNSITYQISTADKIELVPLGYIVKIFDFGNAMIWKDGKQYISTPLFAYDKGVSNLWFNPVQDLICFLESCKLELLKSRKTNLSINFIYLYQNLITPFQVEMEGRLPLDEETDEQDVYGYLDHLFSEFGQDNYLVERDLFLDLILGGVPIIPAVAELKYKQEEIDDVFKKFFACWQDFERYFKNEDKSFVLKSIVCFIKNSNLANKIPQELDGDFNQLVHKLLNELNVNNMIHVDLNTSTMLRLICDVLINEILPHIIAQEIQIYKNRVEKETKNFIEMIEMHGKTSWQSIFYSIITKSIQA